MVSLLTCQGQAICLGLLPHNMVVIPYQHITVNEVAAETSPGSCTMFLLASAKAVRVFSPRENPRGKGCVSDCTSTNTEDPGDSTPVMITNPMGNPLKITREYATSPFSVLVQLVGGSMVIVGFCESKQ